jgi:hypothetical protein
VPPFVNKGYYRPRIGVKEMKMAAKEVRNRLLSKIPRWLLGRVGLHEVEDARKRLAGLKGS